MERRELFKILAATGISAPAFAAGYKPRFFTAAEYEAIDRLCETIIPADADSPGAHAAGVPVFIDTVALHSKAKVLKDGLAETEKLAGKPVSELTTSELSSLVSKLLANEQSPQNDLDRFAIRLKMMTIEAYAVSETGMKHFGYQGNHAIHHFAGCTHPEHQSD